MPDTYRIVRMHRDDSTLNYVVKRGLSLVEARAHCKNPETSSRTAKSKEAEDYSSKVGQPWFDGYEEE